MPPTHFRSCPISCIKYARTIDVRRGGTVEVQPVTNRRRISGEVCGGFRVVERDTGEAAQDDALCAGRGYAGKLSIAFADWLNVDPIRCGTQSSLSFRSAVSGLYQTFVCSRSGLPARARAEYFPAALPSASFRIGGPAHVSLLPPRWRFE